MSAIFKALSAADKAKRIYRSSQPFHSSWSSSQILSNNRLLGLDSRWLAVMVHLCPGPGSTSSGSFIPVVSKHCMSLLRFTQIFTVCYLLKWKPSFLTFPSIYLTFSLKKTPTHSSWTNVDLTFSTTNLQDSYRCLTACNLNISVALSIFSQGAIGGSEKETIYFSVSSLYLTAYISPSLAPFLFWEVATVPDYMYCECCCLQFKMKHIPITENLGENTEM